jgi:hypothetical protein
MRKYARKISEYPTEHQLYRKGTNMPLTVFSFRVQNVLKYAVGWGIASPSHEWEYRGHFYSKYAAEKRARSLGRFASSTRTPAIRVDRIA